MPKHRSPIKKSSFCLWNCRAWTTSETVAKKYLNRAASGCDRSSHQRRKSTKYACVFILCIYVCMIKEPNRSRPIPAFFLFIQVDKVHTPYAVRQELDCLVRLFSAFETKKNSQENWLPSLKFGEIRWKWASIVCQMLPCGRRICILFYSLYSAVFFHWTVQKWVKKIK